MNVVWGIVLIVVSGWWMQVFSAVAPKWAERCGFAEPEADIDPVFHADCRGEAIWDALSLWPMTLAGALLIADHPAWAWIALIGAGQILYFAGRAVSVRIALRRRGVRIGSQRYVTMVYAMMATVAAVAAVTAVMAVQALA